MEAVDFDKILISLPCVQGNTQCESLTMFEDADPYLAHVMIDFFLEEQKSSSSVEIYGEKTPAQQVASLCGTLILGHQISHDGRSIYSVCDDCSGDLGAVAAEIEEEGIALSQEATCRNIFYIDELELSEALIDATNVRMFFDLLPQAIFKHCNIMPDLMCYLIADVDGYYQSRTAETSFDQRSVDGFSPLLFTENGYILSKSGNVIYQETESWMLPIVEG